jgi:hypothetical protein
VVSNSWKQLGGYFETGSDEIATRLEKERYVSIESIRANYRRPDGTYNAIQCASCGFGPVEHFACSSLSSHHGEAVGRSRVNNACGRCGWFSPDVSQWLPWDGTVAGLGAGATTSTAASKDAKKGGAAAAKKKGKAGQATAPAPARPAVGFGRPNVANTPMFGSGYGGFGAAPAFGAFGAPAPIGFGGFGAAAARVTAPVVSQSPVAAEDDAEEEPVSADTPAADAASPAAAVAAATPQDQENRTLSTTDKATLAQILEPVNSKVANQFSERDKLVPLMARGRLAAKAATTAHMTPIELRQLELFINACSVSIEARKVLARCFIAEFHLTDLKVATFASRVGSARLPADTVKALFVFRFRDLLEDLESLQAIVEDFASNKAESFVELELQTAMVQAKLRLLLRVFGRAFVARSVFALFYSFFLIETIGLLALPLAPVSLFATHKQTSFHSQNQTLGPLFFLFLSLSLSLSLSLP